MSQRQFVSTCFRFHKATKKGMDAPKTPTCSEQEPGSVLLYEGMVSTAAVAIVERQLEIES